MSPNKEPRSRRICILCGHYLSSHIDVKCLKIICQDPRIECHCTEFVGSIEDLEIYEGRQARKLNTLMQVEPEKIQIELKSTRVFDICKNTPGLCNPR